MTETEEEKAQRRAEELIALEQQADQWRAEIATWKSSIITEEELGERFLDIVQRNGVEIVRIANVLHQQLETEDGGRLAKQLVWLDAQMFRVSKMLADSEALLDAAEKFYLIPAGRSVMATDKNGCVIPATGSKKNAKIGDEDFIPKYKDLTDTDRQIEIKEKCKGFRRLRDEYKSMIEVIKNRMYLGQRILDELRARNYAAGQAEKTR